ncbi:hypothetical protein DVH24_029269 [Malus domestica]|uniref:Uncharacterized protein n=1 Tax=Malus domestica TaxID=3750 RepID=A0A498HSL3_MALDO|nr:hypothetical protein DVH24_029269 [Malus domestica]
MGNFNEKCHIPAQAPTISQARFHHSMILFALGLDYAFTNFPVGHPSLDFSRANLLNFEVLMKPEANELPKGLVLGRDKNIHIRHRGSTPLGDVRCYNPSPLRGPTRHTLSLRLALIPNYHIPARALTISWARLYRITILSTLGPDHAFTVLFLKTHTRTSQWIVIIKLQLTNKNREL